MSLLVGQTGSSTAGRSVSHDRTVGRDGRTEKYGFVLFLLPTRVLFVHRRPLAPPPRPSQDDNDEPRSSPVTKTRVKIEGEAKCSKVNRGNLDGCTSDISNGGLSQGGRGLIQGSREGEGGRRYGDSGDDDDPFSPYARIDRDTVSDEGLDELLHNSRRNGFLDIRRYRKPGFPRPMRATRLEANHGKR